MTARPDIEAALARADASTPGPWLSQSNARRLPGEVIRDDDSDDPSEIASTYTGEKGLVAQAWVGPRDDPQPQLANAAFIAAARTDVPALAAYALALEGTLRELTRKDELLCQQNERGT